MVSEETQICPVAQKCGGCRLLGVSYEEQLARKRAFVADSLVRGAGLEAGQVDGSFDQMLPSPKQLRYRCKSAYPVAGNPPLAGFYERRTHRIVPCEDCPICPSVTGRIVAAVLDYMTECHVPAYDEVGRKGLVRHILVRNGADTGEILICIVVNARYREDYRLPRQDLLIDRLTESVSSSFMKQSTEPVNRPFGEQSTEPVNAAPQCGLTESVSLVINFNPDNTNVILGKQTLTVSGRGYITDSLTVAGSTLLFDIAAETFFQVNPPAAERLYETALRYAKLSAEDTVLDLYCGIGTITLFAAQCTHAAIGVESVAPAVTAARRNAKRAGIANARFYCCEAGEVPSKDIARPDVVIADPPRGGMEQEAVSAVVSYGPSRLVYVSCNPATLARDLRKFAASGYALSRWSAVDMFPQTDQVESVVLMTKRR